MKDDSCSIFTRCGDVYEKERGCWNCKRLKEEQQRGAGKKITGLAVESKYELLKRLTKKCSESENKR